MITQTTAGQRDPICLNGGYGSQVGLAKSFKVYPGDKVRIEAYAKYYTIEDPGSSNLNGFAAALLGAFGLGTPSGGEVGTPRAGVNNWGGIVAGGNGKTNDSNPKAFVNLLVFDKQYNLVDLGFDGINGGQQVGVSPDVQHDQMVTEYTANEEGYIYVYISNENATLVDVYFDDIKVTHTPGNVIQANEYYPYGLQTANSWTRQNNTGNNFLYNGGTELNQTTQVYDLYYRNYDPVLGRFGQVDPMAGMYASLSPYNYGNNDPVFYNDPLGDCPTCGCEVCDSPVGGSYVASGRGESVYRDMDPYGRTMTARIMAWSKERMGMMRDAQDSEITIADGIHTFIFGPNGTVNYSYTSDEEFGALMTSGLRIGSIRAMFSGTPIKSSYQGGPRLWEDSQFAGAFVQIRNDVAYFAYTDIRYYRPPSQTKGNCLSCGFADLLRYTLSFGGTHPNPFFMAEALYIDGGGSFLGHEVDGGGFFVLVGKDKGKFFTYSEKSLFGTGTDAGGAVELGRIDITGNPYNFTADYVYGNRDKYWVGGGEGPSVGVAYSLGSYNGDSVTAIALQIGFGLIPISAGWNFGIISPTKK